MSEENQVEVEETVETPEAVEETQEQPKEEVSQEDALEKLVQERLSKMKENMDRMSNERDEALKIKAEMERQAKEAEMTRLKEEGKLQELAEMKAADLEAKLKVLEEENVKLRRDGVLNDALAAIEFRNDRSREMARRMIVDELTRDEETGEWLHKSGLKINDYVESYSKDEDNSFLFRVKSNSGGGTTNSAGTPDASANKKISELSTTEVLALAAKGQLGSVNY